MYKDIMVKQLNSVGGSMPQGFGEDEARPASTQVGWGR
jgi:hypothetical protein